MPANPAAMTRVRSLLAEYRGIGPNDLQAVMVQLQATLGASTTSATNDYKVPGDSDLFFIQMWGWLRFPTLDSEDQTILGYLNLVPSERWLIKAQNCLVKLENADKNHKFIDNNDVPLATMMPPMGYPVIWPPEMPGMVPSGQILRATFSLQDTDTDIVSGNTVYGLSIVGVLVPKE